MFQRLEKSLLKGGIFTGSFFGIEDDWSDDPKMSFHKESGVRKLLERFDILYYNEMKKQGHTTQGDDKFWHIIEVIAQKK